MRCLIATGVVLALALGQSQAEEGAWRAAGAAAPTAASSAWNGSSSAQPATTPMVTLSRPVPIRSSASGNNTPSSIRPVAFQPTAASQPSPILWTTDEVHYPDTTAPLPLVATPVVGQRSGKAEDIPVQPTPLPGSQSASSMFGGPVMLYDGATLGDVDCNGVCGPCTGAFTDGCMPRGRVWASAEYLGWAIKAANAPPLLTTAPPGTPLATAGVLGQPTTSNLWDKNNLPDNFRNGGRFTAGFWLPWFDNIGLEASYFFLGQRTSNFFIQSGGTPILARPFTEAIPNTPLAVPTAFPGLVAGSFNVNSSSYLWGAELNVRKKLCCSCCGYLDLLAGYRFFQLTDGINIVDVEQPLAAPPGPAFVVSEGFSTRNNFNGGQIGLDGQWNFWRRWFVGATMKVALGDVHQTVNVNGMTTLGPAVIPFGILALPSNIGTVTRDRFGVLPSASLKIGYYITPRWRIWAGYDFLFLNSVVRAGDQIDLVLNHALLPGGPGVGPVRPVVIPTTTSFWAQGVSLGLEYRW